MEIDNFDTLIWLYTSVDSFNVGLSWIFWLSIFSIIFWFIVTSNADSRRWRNISLNLALAFIYTAIISGLSLTAIPDKSTIILLIASKMMQNPELEDQSPDAVNLVRAHLYANKKYLPKEMIIELGFYTRKELLAEKDKRELIEYSLSLEKQLEHAQDLLDKNNVIKEDGFGD